LKDQEILGRTLDSSQRQFRFLAQTKHSEPDKLMNLITLLGLVAGTLTTVAFLPQLLKVWQHKSAKDISLLWLTTFSFGILLWLVYGISVRALPIILSNAITLGLTSVILFFKLKYR
jgi:MtN3 and saliva related transmembrane protein